MIVRPYPRWDPPEIEERDDDYRFGHAPRCFPLAVFTLGTVGVLGAFTFCFPRRHCGPRVSFGQNDPGGCRPILSCSPTYICYPRTCHPFAG